ncbi:GntR family transcriptional regulator [Schnuerera sp. xch1]|uniref:GntR family transcriptional regulator n=1 Tax=Schnuerera sp. xch1 TaxID=2874283 RepID=UPI001CBE3C5F|nr:GntR family transcriptional regulator [Schnuerera sp. xch1]MBZ2175042.1 GntR family transcriptional regulator [Schnuerera sp. xch1]
MDDYIAEIIRHTDMKQYKPLNEIVFEGIRKTIIKGQIPVGEKINEKEYADRMNISRTPIRDALHRLEKEGLVEYIPRYGVIVKKVSIEDAKEIYQIRKALDTLATVNAMNIMTDEQFQELKNLLNRTEEANRLNESLDEITQLFSEFNEMIYEFSQMPRLTSIVTKLREYLMRFRDISLKKEDRRRKALDEHWMIYRAICNKDEDQVSLITKEHLEYSEKFILEEMERQQNVK